MAAGESPPGSFGDKRIPKPLARFGRPVCRLMMWTAWILIMAGDASLQSRELNTRASVQVEKDLAREMLAAHNAVRSEAKLPPLQWSGELAAFSMRWANILQKKNLSVHNPNSPYGENIFITGVGSIPATAVWEWASESRDYDYRTNSCRTDCGHYTQIVWRETQKVGCALARDGRRDIWVCSYDPPGNYRNKWPY